MKGASSARTVRRSGKRRGRRVDAGLMKYEIIGLVLAFFGIFASLGVIGIGTGNIGAGLDSALAWGFGFGRIVFTVAVLILGLKYIIVRKACPVNGNWLAAALVYVLLLAFYHLCLSTEGTEFASDVLRFGGGLVGAVVVSLLRTFLGSFAAGLALLILLFITIMIWKKFSISRPVAIASDRAAEEVVKVSEKAAAGIHEASRSLRQQWQERHIYDVEKDLEESRGREKVDVSLPQKDENGPVPRTADETVPVTAAETADDGLNGQAPAAEPEEKGDVLQPVAEAEEAASAVVPEIAVPVAAATAPAPQEGTAPVADIALDLPDLRPVEVERIDAAADVGTQGQSAVPTAQGERTYRLPPLSILHAGKEQAAGLSDEVRQNAKILQETLRSFNIDATIMNASQGPAVTRYELEPAAGVKVSKIVHLADDIALKLAATDIRIEAPIPGKAAVGIEVPNKKLTGVALRDVLDTDSFKHAARGVPVSLGKDIAGNPVIADLTKMPHLLVAGSTGSGKSVCINTFIASILFKQRPEDVKLVLIDPKVVELSNYNGIPHLMTPVVTDPKKAANVLRWAVREMDDRYKRFAQTKTRDISRYNEINPEDAMPFVVIIIDELADLMMAASGDVEESICRLAQKARACGMHLVLATQRPSVDVLTGLIKANVPSRIAFAVSSQIDSRTILDMAGAEKLIGKGDMLFYPMGASKPLRVQGAFISDGEIDELVEFIRSQGTPVYSEAVQKAQDESDEKADALFEDELMEQAIAMVLETGQASVSMLQRRFRVGFSRAARMVDAMEALHIVGPGNGSKGREILMTAEEVERKYLHS
ncbi:DNA translocase FtsK 4TM domain-containing protein [Megasphaera vaginalis (ex Srinivasan et al. 2021)]